MPAPPAGGDAPSSRPDRASHGPWLPLVIALGATAVVAFASGPLSSLLAQAAALLGGTR